MTFERDELIRLFGALSDGTISEADHQRLQETLRDTAEARRRWFLFNDIEAGLAGAPLVMADAEPVMPAWRWWWAAAAAAAIFVGLVVFVPRKSSVPVAVLSAATDARWSDPNIELTLRGGELPAGPMRLEAGMVEFAFAGGATAVVEGPAVFEPVATDRLVLQSGRAIGRCATETARLTIVTPNAAVTDLGTEFGVAVGDDQQTRVAVIKGAVELLAGQRPQRLQAGETMAVNGRGQMVKSDFVVAEFSTMATLLRADDLPMRGELSRLKDAGMTTSPSDDPSQVWHGTAGCTGQKAAGKFRICAKGNRLWPLIWQDVPTGDIAGRVVVASARAMQPGDDLLSGLQNAIIKMTFLDEAGREFAKAERHFLRSSGPRDQWILGQIAAIAPAGTARVQFQVLLNARGLKTGSLLFSDPALVVMNAQ